MKKVLLVSVIVVLLLSGCDLFKPPEVLYEVDSNTEVFITISGRGESTEQYSVASLPWQKTFSASRGDFLYVSAQVQDYSSWVSVSIKVNGDKIDDAYSSGDFVIATASGTAE